MKKLFVKTNLGLTNLTDVKHVRPGADNTTLLVNKDGSSEIVAVSFEKFVEAVDVLEFEEKPNDDDDFFKPEEERIIEESTENKPENLNNIEGELKSEKEDSPGEIKSEEEKESPEKIEPKEERAAE